MNNPFAPKPFGSQTGTSMFGGTSTGVFGATSSSSTPAFGASSSPGFGNSSPFGASSVPAFGSSSTSFGGFGQPSSSSFASQSVFGQSNNATSNPFAPKPFGSQSGTSMFGGTSTGVFGATPSSSPFSSTPTFGASSSPGFGNSSPSFGASSTPAFISSSASFGGSSLFGQKPAFGGFGSSTQSSPFGSTFQQSQPAFGSGIFGSSSSFGASSQPSFGASSTPAFGSSSTPAFGSASMPGFGATTTPAFGSTASPTFGSTGTAFGVSSTPAFASGGAFGASSTSVFGSSSGPGFGASSTPTFGASSSPAFGASTTPLFGASSTPAFGTSSSPSFSFGSSPAFGQSTSAFGTSPFGSTAAPFGAQSSPFGSQATTPTFGSSAFGQPALGGQRGGSRIAPYTPTVEADSGSTTQPAMKLESVSAMPVYKDKSHEELRWEDYQLGDKGGPNPASQPAAGTAFGVSTAQSNPFAASSTFGQSSTNPFSASTASNPFAPKQPSFGTTGFGASSAPTFGSSPFGSSSTSNLFSSTSSAATSLFGASSTPAFGSSSSPSLFGASSSSAFGSSPSPFGASSAPGTTPSFGSGLNFGASQSSPLFQSTTPSLGQTGSPFGQIGSSFGQSAPFGQSSIFSTPSTGFGGNIFSSTPAQISTSSPLGFGQSMPSLSTPYQPTQTLQGPSTFGFSNFGQTQAAGSSGFGGASSIFGQSFGQPSAMQSSAVVQPVAVANPFGILPSMPQMSLGNAGSSPSIQYGISSLPVVHKPSPVRISSLLTTRHLSQRRIRLPARKYHPENDGTKVPFFHDDDDDEAPRTPKADALFIPRDNPRALIIRPKDQWPLRGKSSLKAASMRENGNAPQKENEHSLNGSMATINDIASREDGPSIRVTDNGVDDNTVNQKGDSYITLSGHRAGEAAIVYEHGADIESMMPKLRHSDYYTEPRIQELAAKERTEPGFCKHVINFVVGRQGYGSIRFLGETDVRRLDLESIIQFNNREVIVYMDDTKKPPVGQGLNKPAEVTLLNIKCYDKKNGGQYTEGPKIEKYKEMLKKKAEDQGAEFVSYDPVKGEWKFRVSHFSKYTSGDDDF